MEETCVHSLGSLCGTRGGSGKGARLFRSSVVTLQSGITTPVLRTSLSTEARVYSVSCEFGINRQLLIFKNFVF